MTASTAPETVARSARRMPAPGAVLLLAGCGVFLAFLGSTVLALALPDLRASFPGSGVGELSWVLHSYTIALVSGLVVAGRLADRFGRRRMFGAGLTLFTACSALCAATGSIGSLVAVRAVQGVGAAILVAAAFALVVAAHEPAGRARAGGLLVATAAVAAAAGPLAGATLVNLASWRVTFLVTVPIGLLTILAARRRLVESRPGGRRRALDLRGATLLALALGLACVAMVRGPEQGWDDAAVLGAFVGAAAAAAGLVVSSRGRGTPVALLRLRPPAAGVVLVVLAGTGLAAYGLAHLLFLEGVRGYWLLQVPAIASLLAVAPLLGPTRTRQRVDQRVDQRVGTQPTGTRPGATPGPAPAPQAPPADTSGALHGLPLLRGLGPATRHRLERCAAPVELEAGETLFRAGDPSDALYVVRTGRLQVMQEDRVLTELGRGAVLGELGLLTGAPRSATVRAVRDSVLVRLTRAQFDAVADAEVLRDLACGLATRLQEITPPARPRARDVVVAVVGLDPAAPVAEVSAALLRHVEVRGRAVDPGRVDRDGLDAAERCADTVVLTAGIGDLAQHAFCLRVADRVVAVAGTPELPVELPERATGADLVLAGPPATRDQRRAWERRLTPRSTHEIGGRDRNVALRPLGARLAGRSLGLVLGGGGARGFAHLGVFEELEAAGIAVDRVAGTSMGAVIAAFVACGMDAATADAHAYEHFVRVNPLGDYTLPRTGLIRGRRTVTGLEEAFGERLIEELPVQFRCVSTDLLARRAVVHRDGRLSDAVGASLRLPGLYPPLVLRDTLHVDGGVLDNLPVHTLAGPEGPVVAVSIGFGGSTRRSGPPRIPSLGDTLMRTMLLASGQETDRAISQADVVLHPDSTGVGLLEFHQIDRMRDAGRTAARDALPRITALLA